MAGILPLSAKRHHVFGIALVCHELYPSRTDHLFPLGGKQSQRIATSSMRWRITRLPVNAGTEGGTGAGRGVHAATFVVEFICGSAPESRKQTFYPRDYALSVHEQFLLDCIPPRAQ